MKFWYIVAFAVIALLVGTGIWSNVGNSSLSETNNSGKLHMLPGVNTNNTVGSSNR
jgi:hypothetical protein